MPKRILEGDVVSDKMDKTVTVLVERRYRHPVYKKYVKRTDKYAAHDESNAFSVGDRVQIEECSPISKRKKWRVITQAAPGKVRVKAAPEAVDAGEDAAKVAPKKAAAKKTAAKKETKKATSKKKDESK